MHVLVCGGRTYNHEGHVFAHLDAIHQAAGITCLLHGNAKGADSLASSWATRHGVPQESFPPEWYKYLQDAPKMRNIEMVDKLKKHKHGVVVAFPGGRGTAHTVAYARGAGVPVVSISADDWPQGRIP